MIKAPSVAAFFKRVLRRVVFVSGIFTVIFMTAGPGQALEEGRVAVMPFIRGSAPEGLRQTLTCPLGRFQCDETAVQANAGRFLTEETQQLLVQRIGPRVIPLKNSREAYTTLNLDPATATLPDAAQKLGETLEVKYVLMGNVWRFRERIGTAYSVEDPASVAFSLYLVAVADKTPVWQATFVETQQPLSEDLLRAHEFFKRGAKWLSAKELAQSGLRKKMETLPLR